MITKRCRGCEQERPHRPRSGQPDRARTLCATCEAEYLAKWRKTSWQKRKLYDTWKGMIKRCHDREHGRWNGPGVPRYRDYGARGITVCGRWRGPDGFKHFAADVGPPPSLDSTLDRTNTNRGYWCGTCPECVVKIRSKRARRLNVRWASPNVQRANRSNTFWLEAVDPVSGERLKLSLSDWARRTGLQRRTIGIRLHRLGWEPQRAISEPSRQGRGDAWEGELELAAAVEISASCPF